MDVQVVLLIILSLLTINLVVVGVYVVIVLKEFRETIKKMNTVLDTMADALAKAHIKIAEAQDHHPDVFLAWGKVKITLWTHAINGLSTNDFIMAAKIDEIK